MANVKQTIATIFEIMDGYDWTARDIDEMLTDHDFDYWRIQYGWMSYQNNISDFIQMLELFADGFGYEVSAVYDGDSWFDMAVTVHAIEE